MELWINQIYLEKMKKFNLSVNGKKLYLPKYYGKESIKSEYRYNENNPYVSVGLSRETKSGKLYTGFEADVAEFNDTYMKDFHYNENSVNKMGLGIDEVLTASINFSRKNYACYFPEKLFPDDVKLVGNTIKSKKMPEYISKFLTIGIRQLLRGEGKSFIEEYYNYIEKIYNYKIPLVDIASKGNIKKNINEYLKDVQEITKAGRPKSRQAWYELAIKYKLHVDNGDTVYYINTGKSMSSSDIKKVTNYYVYRDNVKTEISKEIDKNYKEFKDNNPKKDKNDWIKETYPTCFIEEEILFNCQPLSNDIINSEEPIFCSEENGIEYNTSKYIDMFNKRITPLLVCFKPSIRDNILIENPKDRRYFTSEDCELCSGYPNKAINQDTYEQLMTMEDKEIKFWVKYDLIPPFLKECGMGDWETIKNEYLKKIEKEKNLGIDIEKEKFNKYIEKLTKCDVDKFINEGVIPESLLKISDYDVKTNNFISKKYNDIPIGNINNILDKEFKSYDGVLKTND